MQADSDRMRPVDPIHFTLILIRPGNADVLRTNDIYIDIDIDIDRYIDIDIWIYRYIDI